MGRKPVSKERIDNPQIKEDWLRMLLPVYIRKGLKKMTMDEVATHLNISKATLYKHFSSREEIIEKALELKLKDIGTFKDDLFNLDMPYIDRYFSSIRVFFKEISGISNEFLSDLKHLYPDIWKRVEFFREYASSLLMEFYKEGIAQKLFNDVDPAVLVILDKSFFDSISDPDFLTEHNISLQKAFRDYFTLRSSGLFRKDPSELDMTNRINEFIGQLETE